MLPRFQAAIAKDWELAFNAITKPMYAVVEDTLLHDTHKVEVAPLTNYNIIVLDKTLKNNSSVTFINTSTLRQGKDYDANVSLGSFDMYTKEINLIILDHW